MLPLLPVYAMSVPDGLTTTPDIHGDKVAFSCEGDIWVGDLKTNRAERLTSDEGRESRPRFSPDGTQISFEAQYDGVPGIYVIPTGGGTAKKIAFSHSGNAVCNFGWTPDGKQIGYGAISPVTWFAPHIVSSRGGAPAAMPLEFVSFIDWAPEGNSYAFTRFALSSDNWFRYVGGMQNQIWIHRDNKFTKITDTSGMNEFPTWQGDSIYFVNEENASFQLFRVRSSGGKVEKLLTPTDIPIRNLAGDRDRLVYEKGTSLEVFDPKKGEAKVVRFDRSSDRRHTAPFLYPADTLATAPSLSPGGKRVFVESRGQIVSLAVGEGEARVWKAENGARLRNAVMSPDGKKVAYWTDATGEIQVAVADADGSNAKTLTNGKDRQFTRMKWSPDNKWLLLADSNSDLWTVDATSGATTLIDNVPYSSRSAKGADVSPDGKWVAYTTVLDKGLLSQIMLYEVATGKKTRVSDGSTEDLEVSFSPDGKYLLFTSLRRFSPEWDTVLNQLNTRNTSAVCLLPLAEDTADPLWPTDSSDEATPAKPAEGPVKVNIDLDGLYSRLIELPIEGQFGQIGMAKDKVYAATDGKIVTYDLKTKTSGILTSGGAFQFSADGSKALVLGGLLRVVDANGSNVAASEGVVSFGNLKLRIDPVAEWKQMFSDAWRHFRDYFYVQNMHGVDWKAVHAKYSAMLPAVASRSELDQLLEWMEGELGCSHMWVSPGDERNSKVRTSPAFLGVEVEPDGSGYYKISRIYRGDGFVDSRGPMAAAHLKVKEGMYLIEVAGVPAKVGEDIYSGLFGRAGQVVTVKVNDSPTAVGARSVLVKPIASEVRLRYVDWVQRNREYVRKATDGKLGYLHLRDMTQASMADFIKQYFSQRDKEAMVVDVRFNTGGNTQEIMNRILNAGLSAFFNQRATKFSWSRQSDYFDGPMACLINEFNISCGEEFPYRFRELKRGAVIGRRTMGGEVGNWPGWPLADGGKVWVPNYGMYSPERGWEIEGRGVEPDIDVPSDPNAYVAGKDPQLDRAITWLKDQLKTWPKRPIEPPKDRDRRTGG